MKVHGGNPNLIRTERCCSKTDQDQKMLFQGIPFSSKLPNSITSLARVQLSHLLQLMPTFQLCDGDAVHVSSQRKRENLLVQKGDRESGKPHCVGLRFCFAAESNLHPRGGIWKPEHMLCWTGSNNLVTHVLHVVCLGE